MEHRAEGLLIGMQLVDVLQPHLHEARVASVLLIAPGDHAAVLQASLLYNISNIDALTSYIALCIILYYIILYCITSYYKV